MAEQKTAMAALRRGTRHEHRSTEGLLDASGWLDSPASYAGYLTRLLRFHRMVEADIGPAAARLDGLDYEQRRRSPVIAADLQALAEAGVAAGIELSSGVDRPSPAIDAGPSEVLGVLYVIEGATLGGRILIRRLERQLGLAPGRGGSSLVPYGPATTERWRRFGAVVETWATGDERRRAEMVDAARRTFASFSDHVIAPTRRANRPGAL